MVSALQPGGHGFDPHCGGVLCLSPRHQVLVLVPGNGLEGVSKKPEAFPAIE
ncbi:hypothetical protein DPMN_186130 [Dreissena polymorpha]|uniref:Uncharacterized protein n=1 Tax=Dreissena polymorpha TaxID=45954 RepID=A0A9D4DMC5_DREPO|nr:hypothetical protein DPMN_186130 [Dreissena polymorpha]